MAKKLSKYKYVPNRNIEAIEVTKGSKSKEIDGADVLDGVYVKKGKYAKGGVMGDVYSVQNPKQFQQLITVYNELSENFGITNYFLDHNDNSVVFLMKSNSIKDVPKIQKYIDSLGSKGFDIFDNSKNKKISIQNDKSKDGGSYFKLKLSDKIEYRTGGEVGKYEVSGGGLAKSEIVTASSVSEAIDKVRQSLKPIFGNVPKNRFLAKKISTMAKGGYAKGVAKVELFDVYEDPNGVLWTVTKFWDDGSVGVEDTETTEKKSISKEELLSNYVHKKEYAKGGKLSKYKYVPNRDIESAEVTKNGKVKEIDGADILDGVYVKKPTTKKQVGKKTTTARSKGGVNWYYSIGGI